MNIAWRMTDGKSEYYYGDIEGSKVSSQIGRSTNQGMYSWAMFHEDIGCAIFGGETDSLNSAKSEAQSWVKQWVKR
ncbi:hypothetical protein P3T73_13790 [Kiritimatiellota bacterium B12222]|nr:hypothetical protein P3T73_13110 [Kiritimatiellota bacterium B12222]WFB35233.1 hypothetical protein P3T73_13790 [Kiritimatiellota bacterium B12222]